jgi:hypothetical protein
MAPWGKVVLATCVCRVVCDTGRPTRLAEPTSDCDESVFPLFEEYGVKLALLSPVTPTQKSVINKKAAIAQFDQCQTLRWVRAIRIAGISSSSKPAREKSDIRKKIHGPLVCP